jgi:hypothetical protein
MAFHVVYEEWNPYHRLRMKRILLLAVLLSACSDRPATSVDTTAAPREASMSAPITDLRFNDYLLQQIADDLVRKARGRNITTVSGRHRVDRLLVLEASLGHSTRAMERVNRLVLDLTETDISRWAELRKRAAAEFRGRSDPISLRVSDLLERWQIAKLESASRYLSSNYRNYISTPEWERRFHEFISKRPIDEATWAWLVLHYESAETRREYGRADSESAYRLYLVQNSFGTGRHARELFTVPGIEIRR